MSRLYHVINFAKVAEELGVHTYATGSFMKGPQFSARYLDPLRFGLEASVGVGVMTSGGYIVYDWLFDD